MKKLLLVLLVTILPILSYSQQNVVVKNLKATENARLLGSTALGTSDIEGSAILTMSSTSKGLLTPRMTTVQRDAISTPSAGLLVYDTDLNSFYVYDGSWSAVGGSSVGSGGVYSGDGNIVVTTNINDRTASWGGTDAGDKALILNVRGSGSHTVQCWANNGVDLGNNQNAFRASNGTNVKANFGIFGGGGKVELVKSSGGNFFYAVEGGTHISTDVGVGMISGASARLHVKAENAAASSYAFLAEDNVGTDLFRIENDGKIGINVADPEHQYHQKLPASSSATYFKIEDNTGDDILDVFGNGVIAIGPTEGVVGGNGTIQVMQRVSGGDVVSCLNASKAQRVSLLISASDHGELFLRNSSATIPVWLRSSGDSYITGGNLGIGTATPATSAILEVASTTGAILFPRMTNTQRDALTAVDGMVIYSSTDSKLQVRAGGAWVDLH